jgi:hypothetical protein
MFWVLLTCLPLMACAGPRLVSEEKAPAVTPAPAASTAPMWHVGDRWRHSWSAGTEKGIKTAEVTDIREMGGSRYYVLRTGDTIWFFTPDLGWAGLAAESKVIARSSPPRPWFVWPLAAGRNWDYEGVYEERDRKVPVRETYAARALETVQVPAGTFRAIRIQRDAGPEGWDEYWYAPEVGWYVKWRGRRGRDEFEEVLLEYLPASSLPAGKKPAAQP